MAGLAYFTEVGPGLTINGANVDTSGGRMPNVRGGLPSGRVLYVNSNGGSQGSGDGTNINAPLAAIGGTTGALARLSGRTNKGDVVYVLPGHTESVSAADYFSDTGAASGFSIIGLGSGAQRPTLTWTAAAATWLLDTAGVEIANIVMNMAGPSGTTAITVAAPITVSGAGCRIVNCYIVWGIDADQIVGIGITTTAAADDFEFVNNVCISAVAAAPTTTFMQLVGADRCRLVANYIEGATSGTTVGVVRGLTTASTNMFVAGNYMSNLLASSTIAFSPLAASTGQFIGNNFFVNSGILPITASIGEWYGNYVCNGAGEAGALVGTASA